MAQQALFTDFTPQPKLRLAEVEEYLAHTGALGRTPPSRQAIINWIEAGELRGVLKPGFGWLIYQSSLEQFLKSFEMEEAA